MVLTVQPLILPKDKNDVGALVSHTTILLSDIVSRPNFVMSSFTNSHLIFSSVVESSAGHTAVVKFLSINWNSSVMK